MTWWLAVLVIENKFKLYNKVNIRNIRKRCETCSKLIIQTQERQTMTDNDVVLVSLLLTLNMFHTCFLCFYYWLWTGICLLGRDVYSQFVLYLKTAQFHARSDYTFHIQSSTLPACSDTPQSVSSHLLCHLRYDDACKWAARSVLVL